VNRNWIHRLSRGTGTPIGELLALSEERDPFNSGTAHDHAEAAWFIALVEKYDLLGRHLRDAYYRALSLGDGDGGELRAEEWTRFGEASRVAKNLGLVAPWAFPDQRTRRIVGDGRVGPDPSARLPQLHVPGEPTLRRGSWDVDEDTLQPVRIIFCVEKDGSFLAEEVVGPCRKFGAALVVTTGFSPTTLAGEICLAAREDGRPVVILWLADADSSGEKMATASARHIEFIRTQHPDVPPIWVASIGFTLDQIAEIEEEIGREIPRQPDATEREEGRVEIQAVAAFAPGWINEHVREALEELTFEIDLATEIEFPEDDELGELRQKAADLFEPIRERMVAIEERAEEIIDSIEPPQFEPPEFPEFVPEGDWLLDPRRSYIPQLNAYRRHRPAHQSRQPLVLVERKCPNCGGQMHERPVQARYCSENCQRAASRARRRT
jgi:hypothetical protein